MDVQPIEIKGKNPCCISFNAQILPATASPLMATISEMTNKGSDEIHLLLSTPGGTVPDGLAIYNFIRAVPARVVTYNIGSVNSIGNVVYQSGDYRICAPTSSFMFHGVGFSVSNARLELKELKERMDAVENDQAMISEIIDRHTSLGTETIDKLFLRMAFLSAVEAKARSITDEIRDIHLPPGLPITHLVFKG